MQNEFLQFIKTIRVYVRCTSQTPSCVLSLALRACSLRNSIFYTKKCLELYNWTGYKKEKYNFKINKINSYRIFMNYALNSADKIFNFDCKILSRSSHSEVFYWKSVLKICSKFTGEHPCQSTISIKLQSNFIEIAFWHGCSPVNFLHIFRTPFLKNTSEWLLLIISRLNF